MLLLILAIVVFVTVALAVLSFGAAWANAKSARAARNAQPHAALGRYRE